MATQWFCKIMGDEQGPLTAGELQVIAHSGCLSIDDLVRKHVDGTWVRAENVVGLFDRPSLPVVMSESIAVIDDFASVIATWQATAGMSAAGQLCSIEIKTSQSLSGESWQTQTATSKGRTTVDRNRAARQRTSNVVVPRRTMKVASGTHARAATEKLANQTTVAGACNSAADTVSASNVRRAVEELAENAC